MNERDKNLMKIYGVTCSTETIYCYKNHKYKTLKDALNYAKIDIKNNEFSSTSPENDTYIQVKK